MTKNHRNDLKATFPQLLESGKKIKESSPDEFLKKPSKKRNKRYENGGNYLKKSWMKLPHERQMRNAFIL